MFHARRLRYPPLNVAAALAVAVMFMLIGAGASAHAQDQPTVVLSPNDTYGQVLTDPSGFTLYTWGGDEEGVSNCYDACANAWPPYTIDGDLISPDDLPGSLGLIDRGDGTWQVTIDNWPLYYFIRDAFPGDTNGDGLQAFGAQWYVMAYGEMAPTVPEATTPPPPPPPPPPAPAPVPQPAPVQPPPPPVTQPVPPSVPARPSIPVQIVDFQFNPPTVNIQVGDTVMWTNNGRQVHTATSDTGTFDSNRLTPGQNYSFTFNSAGTFSYHCAIHQQMRGTIIVGSGSTYGGPTNTNPYAPGQPFYDSGGQYGGNYGPPPPGYVPPPGYPGAGLPGNYQVGTMTVVAPPNGIVVLNWLPTPNAQMYRIYQTNANQPLNFTVVQTVNQQLGGAPQTSATVTGLVPGGQYLFQVRAVDPQGNETPAPATTEVVPAVPAFGGAPIPPPTGLVVSSPSGTGVTLSWASVPGAASYRVLQATSSTGPFVQTAGGVVNGTSTILTGLAPNTTYYFQVQAVDANGNPSTPSTAASAATSTMLSPPTGVAVSSVTSNSATLTWAAAPGAASYQVNVSTSLTGTFQKATITNATTTGATVIGLSPATPYYFQVIAIDINGIPSNPSATANGITTQ